MNVSKFFLTGLTLMQQPYGYSKEEPRGMSNLLPTQKDFAEIIETKEAIRNHFMPCFFHESNSIFPSGYSRFSKNNAEKPRLEMTTIREPFVSNCLGSRAKTLAVESSILNAQPYIHMVSECDEKDKSNYYKRENIQCKIHVEFSKISENNELKQVIESHWQIPKREQNPLYVNTLEVLRIVQYLSTLK
jgi:hypothetical protein